MSNNHAKNGRGPVPGTPPKSFDGSGGEGTCTPSKKQPTTSQNTVVCVQCGNIDSQDKMYKISNKDSWLCWQCKGVCLNCGNIHNTDAMHVDSDDCCYCNTHCYYKETGDIICGGCDLGLESTDSWQIQKSLNGPGNIGDILCKECSGESYPALENNPRKDDQSEEQVRCGYCMKIKPIKDMERFSPNIKEYNIDGYYCNFICFLKEYKNTLDGIKLKAYLERNRPSRDGQPKSIPIETCMHCNETKPISEMYSLDGDVFYCDTVCYFNCTGVLACSNCYKEYTSAEGFNDDWSLCPDCYVPKLGKRKCYYCRKEISKDDTTKYVDGHFYCDMDCYRKKYEVEKIPCETEPLKKNIDNNDNIDTAISFFINCTWFALGVVAGALICRYF